MYTTISVALCRGLWPCSTWRHFAQRNCTQSINQSINQDGTMTLLLPTHSVQPSIPQLDCPGTPAFAAHLPLARRCRTPKGEAFDEATTHLDGAAGGSTGSSPTDWMLGRVRVSENRGGPPTPSGHPTRDPIIPPVWDPVVASQVGLGWVPGSGCLLKRYLDP